MACGQKPMADGQLNCVNNATIIEQHNSNNTTIINSAAMFDLF